MTEELETLAPLKVTCTMASCEDDRHCFKFHSRQMKEDDRGTCRYCGVSLVDWTRVHARETSDIDNTIAALKHEFIRHHFWHVEIDEKADKHARRKGRVALKAAASTRVKNFVGAEAPNRDGQQTPFSGSVLFYAQHATACCCRSCIEYWHGIPKGRELEPQEIAYFTDLIMKYVQQRMPRLPDEPEKKVLPVVGTQNPARRLIDTARVASQLRARVIDTLGCRTRVNIITRGARRMNPTRKSPGWVS